MVSHYSLICLSLVTSNVDHLLLCHQIFCSFKRLSCMCSYSRVLIVLYMFQILVLFRYMFCKYFLPICGLSFHSRNSFFLREEVSKFNEVQLFLSCIVLVLYLKSHHQMQGHPDFLVDKCILFIVVKYT